MTYIHQIYADTGCSQELPRLIIDRGVLRAYVEEFMFVKVT